MPNTSKKPEETVVLVTGAAGMVGSHLIDELLKRGYVVIGIDDLSVGTVENISQNLDHPSFTFREMDVLDLENMFISFRRAEIIVHLAATKKIGEAGSGIRTLSVNTKGTEHVLKLARALRSKVVFGSTSDVYGMSEDLPFREDGDLTLGPSLIKRWTYAVAKLYCEQLASAYHSEFDVPIVILRYFGGFSERSSFSWSGGHVPLFIDAVLNDNEVIIHGDGSQTRSMGYVSDLVEGTIAAMETKAAVGHIINLGNDEELSVLDTAKLIHELADTGKPLKTKFVPFKDVFGDYKDLRRRVPDLTKAKQLLGYEPKVRVREAIALTIAERRRQTR